jgi:hypothetical protein
VWFLLLMIFGLLALFAAMILPFAPTSALPWVIVAWSIAGLAGYRIWRIDHPGASARAAVGLRAQGLLAIAVGSSDIAIGRSTLKVAADPPG